MNSKKGPDKKKKRKKQTVGKKKQGKDYEEKYKKALADLLNLEKTVDSEVENAATKERIAVITEFLDLIDDIFKLDEQEDEVGRLLRKKAENILEKLDVEKLEIEIGKKPNIESDEVVAKKKTKSDSDEKGVVVEIVRRGYRIGNIIIRNNRVIITE